MPLWFRYLINSAGNLCAFPHPTHGSGPIWTAFPSFILLVILHRNRGSAFIIAFHMLEILLFVGCVCLNQSIKFIGHMYVAWATRVQRLLEVMSCQPSLAAKAFENSSSLFMPHPPHRFGNAILSHLTQAKIFLGWLPFHKNLQHILWSLFRMPFGIHARVIQNTGVASITAFMRINLLARERYLWYQICKRFSTLAISHVQSAILYPTGFNRKPRFLSPSSRLSAEKGKRWVV